MSDEICDECGRRLTDDHQAFQDQWEPGREEVCMPIQNFGGYQLCAERQVERLRAALAERDKRIAELEKERDEWRTSASMACESPPSRCDCAGCRFAEQYRAEQGKSP